MPLDTRTLRQSMSMFTVSFVTIEVVVRLGIEPRFVLRVREVPYH